MSITRKIGTLVVFAVPAIVGGGIIYALFGESYIAVAAFEILIAGTAGAFVAAHN